jgi:hypothetical protein
MSAGDGAVRACSIREHLDSCQPAARAIARADNPASILMSRSRCASSCRAWRTLDDGEVTTVVAIYAGR